MTDILSTNGSSMWNSSNARVPRTHGNTLDNALLIFAYSILSVIAIFGNSIVCYVILKNKVCSRLHIGLIDGECFVKNKFRYHFQV